MTRLAAGCLTLTSYSAVVAAFHEFADQIHNVSCLHPSWDCFKDCRSQFDYMYICPPASPPVRELAVLNRS